jgi:hypothetical protein
VIHAALVSAYPTEADARRGLVGMPDDMPYLGLWHAPTPERPEVHVFSDDTDADDLLRAGWIHA